MKELSFVDQSFSNLGLLKMVDKDDMGSQFFSSLSSIIGHFFSILKNADLVAYDSYPFFQR